MIDHKTIVKEMVDNSLTRSCGSLEYNGKWYIVSICLKQVKKKFK